MALKYRFELRVEKTRHDSFEIISWLNDTVGSRGYDWEATISYNDGFPLWPGVYVFVFAHENDKINFILKWA